MTATFAFLAQRHWKRRNHPCLNLSSRKVKSWPCSQQSDLSGWPKDPQLALPSPWISWVQHSLASDNRNSTQSWYTPLILAFSPVSIYRWSFSWSSWWKSGYKTERYKYIFSVFLMHREEWIVRGTESVAKPLWIKQEEKCPSIGPIRWSCMIYLT